MFFPNKNYRANTIENRNDYQQACLVILNNKHTVIDF